MRTRTLSFTGALAAIAFCGTAFAVDAPAPGASGPGGHHRGPSQEAIAACAGKAEGATATFTGRMGKPVTGTCKTGKAGVMAARPDHMHAPHGASAPM